MPTADGATFHEYAMIKFVKRLTHPNFSSCTRMSISTRLMLGVAAIIVAVMGLGFYLESRIVYQAALDEFRARAAVIAQEMVAVRAVAARNQNLINTDSKGNFEFKHLNPAVWGRQVATLFNQQTDYVLKQTRVHPRAPENAPDQTETTLLQRLAQDRSLKEAWIEEVQGGAHIFRYMVPLTIEPSCLPCHGEPAGELDVSGRPKEGLKVGDFGGAISVTVSMHRFDAQLRQRTLLGLGITLLMVGLSFGLIYAVMSSQVMRPLGALAALAAALGRGRWQVAAEGFRDAHRRARGEIKELADALVGMAHQLNDNYALLERKVAERTAQLEKANRFQADFLANVSHELRTPLTSITAQAEILLGRDSGELNAFQEEYLRDVFDSGHELLGMINQLLDMAKLEAGRLELYCDLADVTQAIQRAVDRIRPLAQRKQLRLEVEAEGDLWANLDLKQITGVLGNLLSNAVKFTPAGGLITVRAGRQERRGVDGIIVSVSDTGIGIEPPDLPHVFEKFREVGPSAGRSGGTGIGLALVRHLVELHGGETWAESTPGVGSIFSFFLPAEGPGAGGGETGEDS